MKLLIVTLLFASDQPRGVQPTWNLPASSKVISLFRTRSEASPRAARLANVTQTSSRPRS